MNLQAHKPAFAMAYTKANEILVKSSVITTFPYSAKKLIREQTDIPCRTYSKASKYGVDMTAFGSESAVLMELEGRHIIFYDDNKPKTHIRYSILHEGGHEINGHDPIAAKNHSDLYHRYEIETNYFAAQLLMPEQLIRELQRRGMNVTKQFLQNNFYVSGQAAEKRLNTLAKTNAEWHSREEKVFDDIILMKYSDFLNKICPIANRYDFEDEYLREQERWSWL